jgi:hypothetical protein
MCRRFLENGISIFESGVSGDPGLIFVAAKVQQQTKNKTTFDFINGKLKLSLHRGAQNGRIFAFWAIWANL